MSIWHPLAIPSSRNTFSSTLGLKRAYASAKCNRLPRGYDPSGRSTHYAASDVQGREKSSELVSERLARETNAATWLGGAMSMRSQIGICALST